MESEDWMNLQEFEDRTSLPSKASLEELQLMGGKYFKSPPIMINGISSSLEYVLLRRGLFDEEIIIWKRYKEEEEFTIHLEATTRNKY